MPTPRASLLLTVTLLITPLRASPLEDQLARLSAGEPLTLEEHVPLAEALLREYLRRVGIESPHGARANAMLEAGETEATEPPPVASQAPTPTPAATPAAAPSRDDHRQGMLSLLDELETDRARLGSSADDMGWVLSEVEKNSPGLVDRQEPGLREAIGVAEADSQEIAEELSATRDQVSAGTASESADEDRCLALADRLEQLKASLASLETRGAELLEASQKSQQPEPPAAASPTAESPRPRRRAPR